MQVVLVEVEGDGGAVGQAGAAGQAGEQFFAVALGATDFTLELRR